MTEVSDQTAIELVAAYLETAWSALDEEDLGALRASLRRCSQYMLQLPRWDSINGAEDGA